MASSTVTEASIPPAILLRRPEQAVSSPSGGVHLNGPVVPAFAGHISRRVEPDRDHPAEQFFLYYPGMDPGPWSRADFWMDWQFYFGIGFYSLPRMRGVHRSSTSMGWATWFLWTSGVWLRWVANVYGWHWRISLPVSAVLEAAAFLLFLWSTSGTKSPPNHRHLSLAPSGLRPCWQEPSAFS